MSTWLFYLDLTGITYVLNGHVDILTIDTLRRCIKRPMSHYQEVINEYYGYNR